MRYRFDRFELDPSRHRLEDEESRGITLRPQAFKVLEYLVRRAPSLVSREELLNAVWGHEALSVSGVAQAVREIRRALGDDASQQRVIATRHGCGYQVVAQVEVLEASREQARPGFGDPIQRPYASLPIIVIFGLMLFGLLAGSYWFRPDAGELLPVDSAHEQPKYLDELTLPAGDEARSSYSEGLRAMREMDWIRAAEQFKASLKSDSESVAARLRLVDAYYRAGYEARARDLIGHPALQHASVSRRGKLEIRAQLARLSGDWNEVAHCLRSLVEFFPEQLEYRFALFEALLASGPPTPAREALEQIHSALPANNPGSRYHLALHAMTQRENQPEKALAAARMALDDASQGDQVALQAYAELALGRSLVGINHLADGRNALSRAAEAMRSVYNDAGRAEALLELARLNMRVSRFDRVRELLDPACRTFERIGGLPGIARCQRLEGELIAAVGQSNEGQTLLLRSALGFEHAGSLDEAAEAHLVLGRQQFAEGALEAAWDSFRRADRLFERIGDRAGYAWVEQARGMVFQARGMAVEARIAHSSAHTVFRGLSNRAGEAAAARGMAQALGSEGERARASALFESAIGLYRQLSDQPALAETLLDAGMLAERTGDLAAAERYFGEAAELLMNLGLNGKAALALAELARVHIDQSRASEARETLTRALKLQPNGERYEASLNSMLGYLALLERDLDEAARFFAVSQRLRVSMIDASQQLRSQLDHASLQIERGQPGDAEIAARSVVDRPGHSGESALIANGFVILIESLEMQGRVVEARQAMTQMKRLGLTEVSLKVDLAYQILLCRLDMVSNVKERLRSVRQRADASGYSFFAVEANMTLATKLLHSGHPV